MVQRRGSEFHNRQWRAKTFRQQDQLSNLECSQRLAARHEVAC